MSASAIAAIERTVHTTNTWLEERREELSLGDRGQAYHALRAVPDALRDLLTVAESLDLGAQLPVPARGLYYEGCTPNDKPLRERKKAEFLGHTATALRGSPGTYPEGVARGVFRALERHVSAGEIGVVKSILPEETRSLWAGSEVRRGS